MIALMGSEALKKPPHKLVQITRLRSPVGWICALCQGYCWGAIFLAPRPYISKIGFRI